MIGTKWFSKKHNGWAIVANEPPTARGFYTIKFPELGIYRRYNADRIKRELTNQENVEAEAKALDGKIGLQLHNKEERLFKSYTPEDFGVSYAVNISAQEAARIANTKFQDLFEGRKLVGVLFLFEEK